MLPQRKHFSLRHRIVTWKNTEVMFTLSRPVSFWISWVVALDICSLKPSTRKSTQVCKTSTCVRTCDGWLKTDSQVGSQKVVHFTHIQLTYRSTLRRVATAQKMWAYSETWPKLEIFSHRNRPKLTKRQYRTCVDLRKNLSSTKLVNASGWPNETQVENKTQVGNLCFSLVNPVARALGGVDFWAVAIGPRSRNWYDSLF